MTAKISAIVITKNEEKSIARCLEALTWADEIVVIDSGSTDRTVEICRSYTNRVIYHEWQGSNQQKNFAVQCANYPWILCIDADEIISPELAHEIRALISNTPLCDGYKMRRKNLYRGEWTRWAGFSPNYELRLFRKQNSRFINRLVHDKVRVNGPVGKLNGWIIHDNIQDLNEWVQKNIHYAYLGAVQDYQKGKRVHLIYFLFPIFHFLKRYLYRGGILDGYRGFIFSFLPAYYRWMTLIFLWQIQRYPEMIGEGFSGESSTYPAKSVGRRRRTNRRMASQGPTNERV